MSTYPTLSCDTIAYRAILYPEWKTREGLPKWQNFKRRKIDRDGVSLGLTLSRCMRDLEEDHGILTVHIGRIRDVATTIDPIDVIQDEPEHAIIAGLPYLYDEHDNEIQDIQLKARQQYLATCILEHVLQHIEKQKHA